MVRGSTAYKKPGALEVCFFVWQVLNSRPLVMNLPVGYALQALA